MTLTSWIFGLFLIIVSAIYWVLPKTLRTNLLLAASVVFVSYASPYFTLLLFSLSSLAFFIGKIVRERRLWLIIGIGIPLSILIYFKYQPLIKQIMPLLGGEITFSPTNLAIPLGISFFTFKLIHYLVDGYQGKQPPGSYGQFLLYMFFFPILPSGPIERWQNFVQQIKESRHFRWEYIFDGASRVIIGLFKKLVIADTMAIYAENLNAAGLSSMVYWIAAYAYALQIYFDFSGYSDIAIGSARIFGYRIMENFNYPYFKRNLSLFWKSWHMSLTAWFRDYVFIPLGGSRVNFKRIVMNTLIVMGLTGLWHGAALHFMAWGLYHGAGLIILRLYSKYISNKLPQTWHSSKLAGIFSTFLTFNYVVVGWVFFATNFKQSIYILQKLLFFERGL